MADVWLSHILEVGRESRRRVATLPVCKELLALVPVIAKDWLSCYRQNKGGFGGHERFCLQTSSPTNIAIVERRRITAFQHVTASEKMDLQN